MSQGSSRSHPHAVDPGFASLAALAAADTHGSARSIQIALGERERFADPQSRAPRHDDHAARSEPVGVITGGAHHRDDLLHGARVGWIAQALVARRLPLVKARQGRGRTAATGAIQQRVGMHDALLRTVGLLTSDRPARKRASPGVSSGPSERLRFDLSSSQAKKFAGAGAA
jgi:hypothetical protein